MSNAGKFRDSAPFINSAGISTASEAVTSDHSLRQDIYFQPRGLTPPEIKKYRKSCREVPGVKQLHWGVYNDPRDCENLIHGVKSKESEHVLDCIKGSNLSGVQYFMNSIQEDKYKRHQREPLGKSIIRNYAFPDAVKEDNFKFGVPTSGIFNAKEILYSGSKMQETPEVRTMYNKSHGLTQPGERTDRNYKWYVDKDSHVFGKTTPMEYDGAKKSLCSDFNEANFPKTKIVSKRLEDFRQATSDMVGKPKFKGTLNPSIDENHTFGMKNVLGDTWNVAKCIHGDPVLIDDKMVMPDSDLGKTLTHRSKLKNVTTKEIDYEKTFGIPSVRFDLQKKTMTSNYGNEKDAFDLLYPNPHAIRGLDDCDFHSLITRQELWKFLRSKNYNFSDSEFNLIFEITLKNFPNKEEKVSIKAFVDVMRGMKREFMKYRTLVTA